MQNTKLYESTTKIISVTNSKKPSTTEAVLEIVVMMSRISSSINPKEQLHFALCKRVFE